MKINKLKTIFIFVPFLWVCVSGLTFANERISDYRSDIIVNEDSSMIVNETIKVWCEGNEIKRGIYRDFPTRYRDRYGNRVVVGFEVLEVMRNHKKEPYHIKNISNGKRVYTGQEDVFLETGRFYTYTIKYKTTRQLGFFKDHDELYWNITGNGWGFPIQEVQASVTLPKGITWEDMSLIAYTGMKGEKGEDYYSYADKQTNKARFATTKTLPRNHGLTICVSFPKGFVKEPTREERIQWLLQDNLAYIVGIIGLIVIFFYYFMIWARVGKDLPRGTIIPIFEPPDNLSPAAVRFVRRMGYDNTVFASSVINMAVKRHINIIKALSGFTLVKTDASDSDIGVHPQKDDEFSEETLLSFEKIDQSDQKSLSREEEIIKRELLSKDDSITLKNTNHEIISKTVNRVKQYLRNQYENKYFKTNLGYMTFGILLSLGTGIFIAYAFFSQANEEQFLMFIMGSVFASVGISLFLFFGVPHWIALFRRIGHQGAALENSCIGTIFGIAFGGVGITMLFYGASIGTGIILTLVLFINYLFYHLLKAPTLAGRKLLDKIAGFRMYLSIAEKDRLNLLNPPNKTLELYERFLPYALALDVEQEWSEQFADVLKIAGEGGYEYEPSWFRGGDYRSFSTGTFASSLGSSMSGAISSSSVAPGSSSGGGGGGSSGGGGGGGGGGGW